jgi:hypothetical protein
MARLNFRLVIEVWSPLSTSEAMHLANAPFRQGTRFGTGFGKRLKN